MEETREQAIKRMEKMGSLDPSCAMCQTVFYSKIDEMPYEIFAPRHTASPSCESGKQAHCTCDTCFL